MISRSVSLPLCSPLVCTIIPCLKASNRAYPTNVRGETEEDDGGEERRRESMRVDPSGSIFSVWPHPPAPNLSALIRRPDSTRNSNSHQHLRDPPRSPLSHSPSSSPPISISLSVSYNEILVYEELSVRRPLCIPPKVAHNGCVNVELNIITNDFVYTCTWTLAILLCSNARWV